MWMIESKEWDKEREALIKEATKKAEFTPGWFYYDANRDLQLTWDEVRYVRDVVEVATETDLFWAHFNNDSENDMITYD